MKPEAMVVDKVEAEAADNRQAAILTGSDLWTVGQTSFLRIRWPLYPPTPHLPEAHSEGD
jgi:hypothetical protein